MEIPKSEPHLKEIVLRELVAEKNPRLAARIPGFVYGLMNRLLHIREVNEIIRNQENIAVKGLLMRNK